MAKSTNELKKLTRPIKSVNNWTLFFFNRCLTPKIQIYIYISVLLQKKTCTRLFCVLLTYTKKYKKSNTYNTTNYGSNATSSGSCSITGGILFLYASNICRFTVKYLGI